MGGDEEGSGGGIFGTLKKMYTLFEGDDVFGGGDGGDGGD